MKYQDGSAAMQAPERTHDAETALLTDAHINPATGLATDYLNRFSEAVMLLDMLSNSPEFQADFLTWERADPDIRNSLDTLAVTMTIVLEATRAAMDDAGRRPETVAALAGNAIGWLKPLIARAGALINGESIEKNALTPQEVVDRLMKR